MAERNSLLPAGFLFAVFKKDPGSFCNFDKLAVVEILVESAFCHQFFMGSLLDDASVFHDKDFVCISDRGQTMCNDEAGTTFHQAVKCFLDHEFGSCIDA